tara:strand:- start:234 stop:539 length:306 start_codon:yes stop_codon:yes gene_type:complete
MPYTQEELKDLAFYQNLINEDEQNYLVERERLQTVVAVSGGGYDGGLLTRDESGTIKLFENPHTGQLYDDETSTLFVPKVVDRLRDDDSINEILNRNIREL